MPASSGKRKKGGRGSANELWYALKVGDMKALQTLLTKGADINHVFSAKEGLTPIFLAIRNKNTEMVKFLIKQGCDVNKTNSNGETPLFFAIRTGRAKLVKLLVEGGCDINHRTEQGFAPIYAALQRGDKDIVLLLLDNNVDVNIEHDSKTPFDFAMSLYVYGLKQDGHVTRSRSPTSMRDIIGMLLPRVDWSFCRCISRFHIRLYLQRMATDGADLTLFKDLVKHGANPQIVIDVYNYLFKYHTTPVLIELFTPECFHFFATAHQFSELSTDYSLRYAHAALKETESNKRLRAYITEYLKQPPDLQTLCCQRIRKELPCVERWRCIDELEIPVCLKDMLKLKY